MKIKHYVSGGLNEPLLCTQGGTPYNKPHLDAKDKEIERLRAEIEQKDRHIDKLCEVSVGFQNDIKRLEAEIRQKDRQPRVYDGARLRPAVECLIAAADSGVGSWTSEPPKGPGWFWFCDKDSNHPYPVLLGDGPFGNDVFRPGSGWILKSRMDGEWRSKVMQPPTEEQEWEG